METQLHAKQPKKKKGVAVFRKGKNKKTSYDELADVHGGDEKIAERDIIELRTKQRCPSLQMSGRVALGTNFVQSERLAVLCGS